jgi:hypothetical protein
MQRMSLLFLAYPPPFIAPAWAAITVAGIAGRPMPGTAAGSEECTGVRMSRWG